jgi:hypothetical protein
MSNTLTDLNRNKLLFHQPSVDTALPEHFQDQYPVFVQLLDKYYYWLTHTYGDTSGRKPVSELQTIAYLKDREITADRFLPFIFDDLTILIFLDLLLNCCHFSTRQKAHQYLLRDF